MMHEVARGQMEHERGKGDVGEESEGDLFGNGKTGSHIENRRNRLCSGQSHEGGFAHGVCSRSRTAATARNRLLRVRRSLRRPRPALPAGYERFPCQTGMRLLSSLKINGLEQVRVPIGARRSAAQTRQVPGTAATFRHADSRIY